MKAQYSTRQPLDAFIAEHRITMTADNVDGNPAMMGDLAWHATASHYRCVLRVGKRRMTVAFSQGSAIKGPPTAKDVLDCLASDAASVASATFEDWCGDLDYDVDSIKARATYRATRKQAVRLEALLGDGFKRAAVQRRSRIVAAPLASGLR